MGVNKLIHTRTMMSLTALSRAAARSQARRVACGRGMATYVGHDGMKNYSLIDHPDDVAKGKVVKYDHTGVQVPYSSDEIFMGSNLVYKWYLGVKHHGWERTWMQAYTVSLNGV